MKKKCLFDDTHLIEILKYGKHLINCKSPMKKDYRKCKFDPYHWKLFDQIQFHQRFCIKNPQVIQHPEEKLAEKNKFLEQIERKKNQQQLKKKVKNTLNFNKSLLTSKQLQESDTSYLSVQSQIKQQNQQPQDEINNFSQADGEDRLMDQTGYDEVNHSNAKKKRKQLKNKENMVTDQLWKEPDFKDFYEKEFRIRNKILFPEQEDCGKSDFSF